MHTEDDLLPISALQHLLFCERQTALIHVERLWEENRFTAEGQVLHRNADAAKSETRDGVRITRGLPVHSFELGLYGVCDVVNFKPPEFETAGRKSLPKRIQEQLNRRATMRRRAGSLFPDELITTEPDSDGSTSDGTQHHTGGKRTPDPVPTEPTAFAHWLITPVEYKRGKPKANDCDRVQLCAQAMCLEEMLGVEIQLGQLFYGKRQRRTEVLFDQPLRRTTTDATVRLHELIASRLTPTAQYEKKCDTCSLLPICMPPKGSRSAVDYIDAMIK